MARHALLSLEDATRQVGDRTLWRHVDLHLQPGDRLVVEGPSGSGKTLLLRTLAGLDPLSSGQVRFQGRGVDAQSAPHHRARVMYVPQRPTLPAGTALDALRVPFTFSVHKDKEFDPARAAGLLTALGRPPRLLQARTADLSGGEVQTIQLLRALLLDPTVLLLDEVTSGLDHDLAVATEELLLRWCREPGRALIWVAHDPASRQRMGTRHWEFGSATAVPA